MIEVLDPEWLKANDVDPIGVGSATLCLGKRVDRTGRMARPFGWLIEVTRTSYVVDDLHGSGKQGVVRERFIVPCKVMPSELGGELQQGPRLASKQ